MLTADTHELLRGDLALQELTPEASSRRYYRPEDPALRGWLLVRSDAPPPRATTEWLLEIGVPVPAIGEEVPGAYLVEDFGDRHLAHDPLVEHYRLLLAVADRFATRTLPGGHPNRRLALDAELFGRELALFQDAYLRAWLHLPDDAGRRMLCRALAAEAAAGPQRLQHRDLHSRNVLLPAQGGIVILDHQDVRKGPCFYDLASLATDAYVDLPGEVQELLARERVRLGASAGLTPREAGRRYRCTALQRVLKALGTFGRLLLEGREDYRPAERRARRHAAALLDALPSFRDLGRGWA